MDKRKILFVSIDGLIGDTAWQCVTEGNDVRYYIENAGEREIADGFVPKVDDWESHVDWADLVVFDDVLGQGSKAQKLRQAGKLVVGGSPYTDKLEDDRAFGQAELKAAGVVIIPQENFTSFEEAIAFVRANPNRYVIYSDTCEQSRDRGRFVIWQSHNIGSGHQPVRDCVEPRRAFRSPPLSASGPVPSFGDGSLQFPASHRTRRCF